MAATFSPISPARCESTLFASFPGDKVEVELSPYDLTKARIVFRET